MFTEKLNVVYLIGVNSLEIRLTLQNDIFVKKKKEKEEKKIIKMDKLKFEFIMKAKADGKTNILTLTSITTQAGEIFDVPLDLQDINLHTELIKTEAFKKARNTIVKRHQKRNVWIVLNEALENTYLDEGGNLQFADIFLEERFEVPNGDNRTQSVDNTTQETLTKILEKLAEANEKKGNNTKKNIKKSAETFVLEKFTNKNSNVVQWISLFENECERLNLQEDQEKIEILRLFLEGSALDWYSSMLIKLTLDSEWTTWRDNFCETYADKGWTPVKHAIFFKYMSGSLLDYALRKEKVLLEMNKSIDVNTLIDLIAAGLPDFITDKINRKDLKQTKDLFNELRSLEHLIKEKDKKKIMPTHQKGKILDKEPCKICKGLGKGNRYHPEQSCWFKANKKIENDNKVELKYTHNSEIETELRDVCPKN